MPYTLREHTADIAVEAHAASLDGVFGAVADGLAAAMFEDVSDDGETFTLTATAESGEALLFDYLDELIYQRDVRDVLPVDNQASVQETADGWVVDARARGVPLSTITAREVKAVTYSEMELEQTDTGWRAYVVFDV